MSRTLVRLRKWLVTPGVLFVLALTLLFDAILIPASKGGGHGRRVIGNAYRDADGRLVWALDALGVPSEIAPPPGAAPLHIQAVVGDVRREGWWAPTRETQQYLVWDGTGDFAMGPLLVEVQHALLAFGKHTNHSFLGRMDDLVRRGELSRTRALPMGYVHNLATLTAAAMLAPGLVFGTLDMLAERKAAARRARGQCAGCGYDLSGGHPPHSCPECGNDYFL